MRKLLLPVIALSSIVVMEGKGLDLQSRIMLRHQRLEQSAAIQQSHDTKRLKHNGLQTVGKDVTPNRQNSDKNVVMGFVKIEDGYDAADIEATGMNVLAVRGRIAIVSMAADSAEVFASRPGVRKLSLQRPVRPLLDVSRKASGVDAIHSGDKSAGLNVPYTGKGVMALIVDQGVDPNHIAFLDETGKSRVKYLTDFDGTANAQNIPNYDIYGDNIFDYDQNGNVFNYPTVDKFTTDEISAYHGTHTMNILAGGYKGDIKVAVGLNGKTPVFNTVPNKYYGVATDAELAVSCGSLQDACIAFGLNGLLDYAAYRKEENNMPSVVSLSLGGTSGPHDPKGLMNQFLEECGKESIIVIASGNEGDLKIALHKNMTAQDNTLSTMIYPYGYRYDPANGAPGQKNTYYRNGAVFVYSDSEKPFTLRALVFTGTEGNYRKRTTLDISSEEGRYYLSDNYYQQYVGGNVNNTINRYFDGYIGGGTMYDEDLGRYYGVVDYYLYTNPETGFNEDGSEGVIVGFEVIGEDGQRIECYGDGMNTWMDNYGMADYDDGMRDGTISDMAVGHNVLVVGAYTLTNRWTSLNGEMYGYYESQGMIPNDIGYYTSFGTLADGRTLPHVCAPGSAVISAMSTPYIEDYFKGYEQYIPQNFQAVATVNNRDYYWKEETGTSMSTPFVAGSIALWLEANPALTIDDVRDIIAKTAVKDEYVNKGNPVQWGAGKFDALAGLKEVINRTSVPGITVDGGHNDRLIVTPKGNGLYNIFVGEAANLNVNLYNINGTTVYAENISGNETDLDLSNLAKGIYILTVNNHSHKIQL